MLKLKFVNMSKRSRTLRALVTERLTEAAEEICELLERTIAEYEEELWRSKEENQRRQEVLQEENQRRQEENLRRQEENQRRQEENQRRQEENQRRQEENQRRQEENQRRQEVLQEENQRRQEVLQEENQRRQEENQRRQEESQRRQEVMDAQVQTATPEKVSAPGLEAAQSVEVKVEPDEPEHRAETQGGGREQNLSAQWMEAESDGGLYGPKTDWDMSLVDNDRSLRNDRREKKLIPLKRNLRRHRQVPGGDKTFSYSVHTNGFMQRAYVSMYVPARPGETAFCCPVCARQFKLEDQLKRHMSTHAALNGFSLTKGSGAQSHEQASDRPFSCSQCNARFRRRVNLNRHVTVHCEK